MLRITPEAHRATRQFRELLTRQIERSPRGGPMVLTAIVGLGAGLAAVGPSVFVELSDRFFFDIVKGRLARRAAGRAADPDSRRRRAARRAHHPPPGGGGRGHAIPEVMAALDSRGGRLSSTDAIAKMAAATLTIGSGGAVGRQGPVVFLGASFGSLAGRALRLNDQTMRLLAAAGAAGGVAGIFNAPIAGVFFALEVPLRRFGTRNFSVIVLSSVVATVTAIQLRGDELAIPVVTHHGLNSAAEAPLYAVLGVLGVLCGLYGVAFIRIFYWTEDGFARLTRVPGWLLPATGGRSWR